MDGKKIEARLRKRVSKALASYRLIEDGDHLLIALSGGKDSLFLTELLGQRSQINYPKFKVCAVHVRMENIPYESDTQYLEDFCNKYHVELHIITTKFNPEPQKEGQRKKPECFLCAWQRRKQIFNLAQELGCNKICLGHHMDDIIHTALLNEIFEGQFTSMPVKLRLRKMPLTIIRPLDMCHEEDIKTYAEQQGYRKQKKLCPFEKETHRARIAELFRQMEAMNPEARYSIWHALETDNKLVEE